MLGHASLFEAVGLYESYASISKAMPIVNNEVIMTATPRILPAAEPLPPVLAERMAKIFPPSLPLPKLYLTMARNEALFCYIVDSGLIGPTGLLDRRSLPKLLRETIILRTCVAARNDYEFNLHVQTISVKMGLTLAQIDDIRRAEPNESAWPNDLFVAMALVDALVKRLDVDDQLFALACQHFDEPTLLEMTQIVGLYIGIAMLVAVARPHLDQYRAGPPVLARVE
jgi:4-carboxymuconolactone decarboxylase